MKIGFIGAGKMAEAMLSAFITARVCRPHELFASDVNDEQRRRLKQQYGINTYQTNDPVADMATTLFLAVKPQDLSQVLRDIAPLVTGKHLVFSIAAGRRIASIEAVLPEARVIRVMPNLACVVAQSMSIYAPGTRVTPADRKTAERLLGSFGRVMELPETQFDAVTALSGSGPAFFTAFLSAMVDAAVEIGLSRDDALLMAEQTMLGTATVLLQQKQNPAEFIASVASAKGTTAEGLRVLDASPLRSIVREMIRAAASRSVELSA